MPKERILMPRLLARLKINDYAKFKPVFDQVTAVRKRYGSKGGFLLRDADNPNELTVILEWDSLENARKYTQSPELKKALQTGDVIANFYFLDEVEKVQA
jgi:heme-degrading monooxygenase HmoA